MGRAGAEVPMAASALTADLVEPAPRNDGLGPIPELRIAMGAPRVICAVVVCLGKALLGPFGL